MSQVSFGIGTLVARRTDIANVTPIQLGVTQRVDLDIDQALVELYGAYKDPYDVAPGKRKITGKAKFARLQVESINNLILSSTQTSASGFDMAAGEAVAGTLTTFTVTNGSTFVQDLGTFYTSTGIALNVTSAAPSAGYYIAGAANTGTYTRSATDASLAMTVYYTYGVTTLTQGVLSSQFLGSGPIFEMYLSTHYNFNGTTKIFNVKLNACRASRITFPFENVNYTVQDLDFQAFMDASGTIGTWALSE